MESSSVLVFENALLDRIGRFEGYSLEIDRYLTSILGDRSLTFLPRLMAENNPKYKQLIPYVLLFQGDRLFTYVRGQPAVEQRLHKRRSIGLGGHIDYGDTTFSESPERFYYRAVRREIKEEVGIRANVENTAIALLNDDSDEVGRVHFGVLHVCHADNDKILIREPDIMSPQLMTIAEITRLKVEFES